MCLAHRQRLAADPVVLHQPGAAQDVAPGLAQVIRVDVGQPGLDGLLDMHAGRQEVAPELRQDRQPLRGELDLLVFQQSAHQFGARVVGFLACSPGAGQQQHARLDLDQHRGHQQVFAGELEVASRTLLDIAEVLAREVGHRDVEDVEVLLADQIQQQVERAFEGLRKTSSASRADSEGPGGSANSGSPCRREKAYLVDRSARIGLQAIRWSNRPGRRRIASFKAPRRGSAQRGPVW